ncbi:MAG: cytochrome C [Denitrovibrio sp.]|nr:MAG: cytochrome C [Denitrovibrio sp.]
MKKSLLAITFILSVSLLAIASTAGSSAYSRCKGCHGADGAKKALGVGAPLKGQSAAEITSKLNGYKDGSYGGTKKSTMESQAKRLSNDDISALADYISKF